MSKISLGKYRALQRASTRDGIFTILALDHQDSLRRAMNPVAPHTVSDQAVLEFKQDVVGILAPEVSGVLLDPVYGAAQAIATHLISGIGLLVELEKADYGLEPLPLHVEIDPDWHTAKIKRMGADGVKLFFYYNPADETYAAAQDRVIEQVVADCVQFEIPLYAEPILVDTTPENFTDRVIAAAQRVAGLGVDILKLEFPSKATDERIWNRVCYDLSQSLNIPWVLLSAGVDFETYGGQVEAACQMGASGFMAGRAVWGEAAIMPDRTERQEWLFSEGRRRMRELATVARRGGTPWWDKLAIDPIATDWYKTY